MFDVKMLWGMAPEKIKQKILMGVILVVCLILCILFLVYYNGYQQGIAEASFKCLATKSSYFNFS